MVCWDSKLTSPVKELDDCSIWRLPDEIILSLLGFLAIEDLLNVLQTCRKLNYLGNAKSVLAKVGFGEFWPKEEKLKIYQRAARAGNFEANIKLGVACLYGEGCEASPEVASEMLIRAEQIAGSSDPFSWLLYRPPWSSNTCSKACIFKDMKKLSEENKDVVGKKFSGIMFCVAKTMWLQTGEDNNDEARMWFDTAAKKGCGEAAFELFKILNNTGATFDVGQRVDSIRYLRDYCYSGSLNVQMALCGQYVQGHMAGVSVDEAILYFRDVVKKQSHNTITSPYQQKDLDRQGKMRYILVDWLVEVADLKQFSRDTLYMTVSLVDRYLSQRMVTRKTLQLLGIACMVIAARFSENEVITIREAAWLTDNTYTYELVVRTMGKALCAARGNLRVSTHLDFLRLFIKLANVDSHVEELMHLVSELVLLHMAVANSSPVLVAAAVVYFTLFAQGVPAPQCWPETLQRWSNLSIQQIAPTIIEIQKSCFLRENVKDHRGMELQAVNERYERRTQQNVSDFVAPTLEAVVTGLAPYYIPPPPQPNTTPTTLNADGEVDEPEVMAQSSPQSVSMEDAIKDSIQDTEVVNEELDTIDVTMQLNDDVTTSMDIDNEIQQLNARTASRSRDDMSNTTTTTASTSSSTNSTNSTNSTSSNTCVCNNNNSSRASTSSALGDITNPQSVDEALLGTTREKRNSSVTTPMTVDANFSSIGLENPQF